MSRNLTVIFSVLVCGFIGAILAVGQESPPQGADNNTVSSGPVTSVVSIKPHYLPPSSIIDFLGIRLSGAMGSMRWQATDGLHMVEIRNNDVANVIIVSGEAADVSYVESLINAADVPPRQIEIEVKIIEINAGKARDLGIDWQELLISSQPNVTWRYSETRQDVDEGELEPGSERKAISRDWTISSSVRMGNVLRFLDESGAGTVRTAPKILTLNNRRATILDGQRVTYVTRYASYTNLFETDSMDAGLTVSVLPSIGESGYITLDINAESTMLEGEISGSPIKRGQLIQNTVIVKDGQAVLLGGLTRTAEVKQHKRFPLLGHVLPFLFSREITSYEEIESFMVLTPRVVDFAATVDEATLNKIEGR